jgi:hypothetical protein
MLDRLTAYGIQPTPQRIAVAEYVLNTANHPTADEVWMNVRDRCPTLSRATVYDTLNLFAEKGLLRTQSLKEGVAVFDPHVAPHHHFIDYRLRLLLGKMHARPEAHVRAASRFPSGFCPASCRPTGNYSRRTAARRRSRVGPSLICGTASRTDSSPERRER